MNETFESGEETEVYKGDNKVEASSRPTFQETPAGIKLSVKVVHMSMLEYHISRLEVI
jgi:hypothetical protein